MTLSKKELKPLILQIFKENPTRLMNYKQVAARLGMEKASKNLIQLLDELKREERLGEIDHGKYHFIHQINKVEGYIEVTQRGSAYLLSEIQGEEDIFIST